MTSVSFESYQGPGDDRLGNSLIAGYQPASRVGEVVINAFVDTNEFGILKMARSLVGKEGNEEYRPQFYAWASCSPGMLAVARKKRTSVFRSYTSAENACPVTTCASCLLKEDESNFFFAGVVRSSSVWSSDNDVQTDNFFTLSIGGIATVLNTSGGAVMAGDNVAWTFAPMGAGTKRGLSSDNPRRISITKCTSSDPQCIGRALSFAKGGEPLDILLRQ